MTVLAAAPTPSISFNRRIFVMAALLLSTALASLDSSFVPIAFRDMIDDLDTSTSVIVWVSLGYLIAATGPMLFLARIGDRIGQARLFQIGTAVYSLAMIACTWAPDVGSLVALRAVQGLGMGMFLPATFSIGTQVYPESQRGRVLGLLAAGNAFGFVLGPIFASFLLDAYDWRAIFAARIPIGILAIALAYAAFAGTHKFASPKRRQTYDFIGALLLTFCFTGLLFGFNRLPVEDNHLDWFVWGVFAIGIAMFALFVRQERRTPDPLVDVELFRLSPTFTKTAIAFVAMFASFPVTLFVLPIFMIAGMEVRPWDIGIILGVGALSTFLTSPFAGRLADRYGAARICTIGTLMAVTGFMSLLLIEIDTPPLWLLIPLILKGVGTGLFFSPNNALLLSSVPKEHIGMAAGMIGTLRQAGYALGLAVIASLFTALQDGFESGWSRAALQLLSPDSATAVARMFEEGGIWSPEMMLYIFRVSAIICSGILILTLVNSIPRLQMTVRRHAAAFGLAAVVAVGGVLVFGSLSSVSIQGSAATAASRPDGFKQPVAFGMSSRVAKALPPVVYATPADAYGDRCAACHGSDGRGLPDLGVDLTVSHFIAGASDPDLAAFIVSGRAVGAPENRTGRDMPGFADLDPRSMDLLVAYVRGLRFR
jgi:EmrB/QacA subfamily drug resistance transporter